MMNESNVALELELITTTDQAYKVSDGDTETWLPRSAVESMDLLDEENELYEFTIPFKMAKDKGLV